MPQVYIEFFFPLSQLVRKSAAGSVTLSQDIGPDESVLSLVREISKKHRGLRSALLGSEKEEITPLVLIMLNGTILSTAEFHSTKLKDSDTLGFLPAYVGG